MQEKQLREDDFAENGIKGDEVVMERGDSVDEEFFSFDVAYFGLW